MTGTISPQRQPVLRGVIWSVALIVLPVISASILQAQSRVESLPEYEIKAAFLPNFIRFTEWPAGSRPDLREGVVIGIIGESPFDARTLANIGQPTSTRGPIEFRILRSLAEADGVCLLFVSKSEEKRLSTIIPAAHAKRMLTVGETEAFAQEGGMIRFVMQNGTVRFEINQGAAERTLLKLSSKLLAIAKVVRQDTPGR